MRKVVGRNQEADNKLMELGSMLDEVIKGKYHDWNNINNKPSKTEDMYMVNEDINMMHRRVMDEYPEYAADGSFKRAIEDPGQSPAKHAKEIDDKTSLVNQASIMKAKNNA